MSKKREGECGRESMFLATLLVVFLGVLGLSTFVQAADPVGFDSLQSVNNSTKGTVGATFWNISGGYISTFNLTATVQNTRWKAFVGNVTGSFTLDDASGSTIYDWTLSSITGRIYATRNDSSITWAGIQCSNVTYLEQENQWLVHTNNDDNLTATFNTSSGATHDSFYVGASLIGANSCPTLNTYVNDNAQDSTFEEVALLTVNNDTVYASILEQDSQGYDGSSLFDFQLLVPENGSSSFTGATAYYLYVELGS